MAALNSRGPPRTPDCARRRPRSRGRPTTTAQCSAGGRCRRGAPGGRPRASLCPGPPAVPTRMRRRARAPRRVGQWRGDRGLGHARAADDLVDREAADPAPRSSSSNARGASTRSRDRHDPSIVDPSCVSISLRYRSVVLSTPRGRGHGFPASSSHDHRRRRAGRPVLRAGHGRRLRCATRPSSRSWWLPVLAPSRSGTRRRRSCSDGRRPPADNHSLIVEFLVDDVDGVHQN